MKTTLTDRAVKAKKAVKHPVKRRTQPREQVRIRTIRISLGVVSSCAEAMVLAAERLEQKAKEPRKPFRSSPSLHNTRADFFNRLRREFQRLLLEEQEEPICVGYETRQKWQDIDENDSD